MTDRIHCDPHTTVWAGGRLVAGGNPWRFSALRGGLGDLMERIHQSTQGVTVTDGDAQFAKTLINRGLAHLEPGTARTFTESDVCLIIPVHNDPDGLRSCLASLPHIAAIVVDDASTDRNAVNTAISLARGATDGTVTLIRLEENVGPGEARNRGVAACDHPVVLMMDADCIAHSDLLRNTLHHFDFPSTDVVAPRVVPQTRKSNRLESLSAPLDMGPHEGWVRPGGRIPFVPSAALLARCERILDVPFDRALRVGEDVDMIWRMHDAGMGIRFEPRASVEHRVRHSTTQWLRRMYDYGTSASPLSRRHPGRLAAADVSMWNALSILLAVLGLPGAGVVVQVSALARLHAALKPFHAPLEASVHLVGAGLVSDGRQVGSALRREWWPLGLLALALTPRARMARRLTLLMLAPLVQDYRDQPRDTDLLSYVTARLLGDFAYGLGVTYAAIRDKNVRPLLPRIRTPRVNAADATKPARRP